MSLRNLHAPHAAVHGDQPLAVSPAEAARLLGVGRTSLYKLLEGGQLRSVKLGARRVIPMAALHQLLRESIETA